MARAINGGAVRAAGYTALVRNYNLQVLPNWHESDVAAGNTHRVERAGDLVRELFPARYWPGDSFGDHLEFALKYDGTNLGILAAVFHAADQNEVLSYVRSKPTGKYARRIWYLYEMLTGNRLPISDLKQGNYVDLLDPDDYYVSSGQRVRRQRVRDNLLGDARFCPVVRRTDVLKDFEHARLGERCRQVIAEYPVELMRRALNYLYTKETKSSFEIENITPGATRTARFVALLQAAEQEDFVGKEALIGLQNRIVDKRFQDDDYRQTQNYVGETVAWQRERVLYAAPQPGDLPAMMEGLISAHRAMSNSEVNPVVHATAVAFGFVFLHPFEDGNGRIHRFLIHNILARRGFTPKGVMFPVSAAMLKDREAYDAALEAFSRPLMSLVEYSLDESGRMTVHNDTATFYRFVDMTAQAELLFGFIRETIETELVEELSFLRNYDETKRGIQSVVDMPDRLIDLFIRFCLQNNGQLPKRRRARHFPQLKGPELKRMEKIVRDAYEIPSDMRKSQ